MSLKKHKGFTLIEILVALVILSSAVMILLGLQSSNTKRVQKAVYYHKAVQLLERKITELEIEWSKTSILNLPDSDSGTFEDEPEFSWTLQIQSIPLPNPEQQLQELNVKNAAAAMLVQSANQFLSQSIKEAQLTIHQKKGPNNSKYSLTTYIVDYTQSISIGGL